jgi:hypothetical protein
MNTGIETLINAYPNKLNMCDSCIQCYGSNFNGLENGAYTIVQIGIDESIKVLADHFINSIVYGIDEINSYEVPSILMNNDRIKLYTNADFTSENIYKSIGRTVNILIVKNKFDLNSILNVTHMFLQHSIRNPYIILIEKLNSMYEVNMIYDAFINLLGEMCSMDLADHKYLVQIGLLHV